MASLKDIKIKVLSYKKMGTVTHAMEAVSAVKMRKSQERALAGRSYAAAALTILERIAATSDVSRHPLMQQKSGNTCMVIVTSDKGLAGSFNSGVVRKVEREIAERGIAKSDLVILAIGRRGGDYFASRGYNVVAKHENVADGISESEMRFVTDHVLSLFSSGGITSCFVVYQNFISTFEQVPTMRQIVPITRDMIAAMVAGIRPVRGKYAPHQGEPIPAPVSYTIEPDADTVLSTLLPRLLNIAVFHALLEAKASEHSARMVAMKSATDKSKEMAQTYQRTFNKIRQAAITREVSEITSGIEAMK